MAAVTSAGRGARTLSALYPLCLAQCLAHDSAVPPRPGERFSDVFLENRWAHLEEAATSLEHAWGQGRDAGGSHVSLGWIKEESRRCNGAKFSSGGGGGEAKQDTAQEGPEMIKVTRPYHSHQPSL